VQDEVNQDYSEQNEVYVSCCSSQNSDCAGIQF